MEETHDDPAEGQPNSRAPGVPSMAVHIHVCNFAVDLCHRMSKSTPQLPHFGKQMLQVKKDSDLDSRLRQVVHDDD